MSIMEQSEMATEITPEQQQLVDRLLADGQYASENAVMDEALQLLRQRDELRSRLQVGIEQLDVGKRTPAKEAIAGLRAELTSNE